VLIREVLPGTPADKALLQADRIITRVNGQAVTTPAEFYAQMARASGRIELGVRNDKGREETVTLAGK
jgi:S1-C subfamily serine protease